MNQFLYLIEYFPKYLNFQITFIHHIWQDLLNHLFNKFLEFILLIDLMVLLLISTLIQIKILSHK